MADTGCSASSSRCPSTSIYSECANFADKSTRMWRWSVVLLMPLTLHSQEAPLYEPVEWLQAIERGTRTRTGQPGPAYWQNRVDYDIHVRFYPDQYALEGRERIRYYNHSPDTLHQIVLSLLGEIYDRKSRRDMAYPPHVLTQGMEIQTLSVLYKDSNILDTVIYSGTNAYVRLTQPCLPGDSVGLDIQWTMVYPDRITIRNGHYGDSTFFIGHWYPKVAVYDDLFGWDRIDYTGMAEFYGEWADYRVSIEVPSGWLVWATGSWTNPDEVLTEKYLKRWKNLSENKVTHIVTEEEAGQAGITRARPTIHWTYEAREVVDFAFAVADDFCWDARLVRLDDAAVVLAQTAYAPGRRYYPRIIYILDTVLTVYSHDLPGRAYPYPVMTIFNGHDGMEYPMMCNNAESNTWAGAVLLTYHEVAHTYFPFYMGTNERRYAWMDEGWATLLPHFFIDMHSKGHDYFHRIARRYLSLAGKSDEVPLMIASYLLHDRKPYRQASYYKAFFALYYLYDYLGKERFRKALHYYMDQWHGKHPAPHDFFYAFNTAIGEDLNWYWDKWYFRFGYTDLSLQVDGHRVTVTNKGGLPLPVVLHIRYRDGSTEVRRWDLSIWRNSSHFTVDFEATKEIEEVRLGDDHVVDLYEEDNCYRASQ